MHIAPQDCFATLDLARRNLPWGPQHARKRMNFLTYSCEIETFDGLLPMARSLPCNAASREFIAQRNIRFHPIENLLATEDTEITENNLRFEYFAAKTPRPPRENTNTSNSLVYLRSSLRVLRVKSVWPFSVFSVISVAKTPYRVRSMRTPTSRALGTTPILESSTRTHCASNLDSIKSASVSASGSSRWKRCEANTS